jgi:hypothetical protein
MICCMLFLKEGSGPIPHQAMQVHSYEDIPVGLALCGNALSPVGQVGHKGAPTRYPRYGGEVLIAHLVEVLAPLFVRHDDETKYRFRGQMHGVLWFFWRASIFPLNVLEIPLTGGKKPFPKCFVVEDEGDRSPLDARCLCHVTSSPFA